jgi:hypothetical protein
MNRDPQSHRMACAGAPTKSVRDGPDHMEECESCGTRVAWDLVDHAFFGFRAGCARRDAATIARGG